MLPPASHAAGAAVTTDKLDIFAILSRLPMFLAATPENVEQLATASRERRLSKGETLFQRGDPARGFFVVVFGQIKLAFSSPQGSEKVVEVIGPQQSFGEAVMFMDKPCPVFAEALMDTLLVAIPRNAVFEMIESDPAFSRHLLAGLSMRLHQLIHDVESYSLRSSTQRLLGYLLQHCPDPDQTEGSTTVELPTSKQVVASRLNLTPETLSRILHELAAQGLITVQGGNITINDLEKLRSCEP